MNPIANQDKSFNGGGERARTDDLLRAKQALSQLSYTPKAIENLRLIIEYFFYLQYSIDNQQSSILMVGLVGIEPTTSRLSGVRSNRD